METPTPTPTYPSDDCSACCLETDDVSLACCNQSQERNLFGTVHGECSGLPCCYYGGRKAQNHQAWYPCLVFPACQEDSNLQGTFCGSETYWSYIEGANFNCTDNCCSGPLLASNVWRPVANGYPGQYNATFAVTFTPSDFLDIFYPDNSTEYLLVQITLASPIGYSFTENATCWIQNDPTDDSLLQQELTTCAVSTFEYSGNRTYLTLDIPEAYRGNDTFIVIFDGVTTPSGIDVSAASVTYSTTSNLSPVYYTFDNPDGTVFDSFFRVVELESASLSSGSFLPENIYPGNSGNASMMFYAGARIPKGSTIEMQFASKWKFDENSIWTWASLPDSVTVEAETEELLVMISSSSSDSGSTGSVAGFSAMNSYDNVGAGNVFTQAVYDESDNWWTLLVDADIEKGWLWLAVDYVQNPSVSYSGLNFATIQVRDPSDRLVAAGQLSAISVDAVSDATTSPYNYVTLVVLIGTLLFCTIVIRSNGLTFSLGSIWTDLTAICTLLALITAILNNVWWAFDRSKIYFYLSSVVLCFTFTMLTAVCFHWGTVLNLHLRKLPKMTTVMAFGVINGIFYTFQVLFLYFHRNLIARVYESEEDAFSYANQQCKSDDWEPSGSVFSDIQGFLWICYAENENEFFLVSSTITSGLFLALVLTVMALGVMVMRRGKLLLSNATGPHQIVLVKALRLYYALIGVVTMVYLLSWIVQLASRKKEFVPYPWYYLFTVWLPLSIPPSCLIFLQWNATAKSLKDAETGATSPLSHWGYGEIRTPSFAFSTSDRWTEGSMEKYADLVRDVESSASNDQNATNSADDYVGLSMSLEMNEVFSNGCFVAIQRWELDEHTKTYIWRRISNTDTVHASNKDAAVTLPNGRYLYTFLSVPRIPVSAGDEKIRMVVYALNSTDRVSVNRNDHSEMTAAAVLAALERGSSHDDDEDYYGASSSQHTLDSSIVEGAQSSQMIDELFEVESDRGSTEESMIDAPTFNVVAEFTVSTGTLVTSGARSEQILLPATENSYKQFGSHSIPPMLSVHTVIPKATGGQYGFGGGIAGLASSHSISSQYHIREQGLLVVEDLTESRFSNWIPRQVLEVIIRYHTKGLLIAENELARLEAYDQMRQKGSDRGIYENLIQQIQDDGDLNRCREWMLQRCQKKKEYLDLLRHLRRLYVIRDRNKNYFKPSTEKKNPQLRFLPINLHIQEMWVAKSHSFTDSHTSVSLAEDGGASVYDIVTVGAMAAHVYKFKTGGILGLEEHHAKLKPRCREEPGSVAAHHQIPLWTEEEQKADDFEWDIVKRMDVCFPQAVATLVTAFTRKIDLALQNAHPEVGRQMLEQIEKLGFLFQVESLVSTHGNEAGMLEDMAGALNELRNVRFVLVDESDAFEEDVHTLDTQMSLSFHMEEEEETKQSPMFEDHPRPCGSASSSSGSGIAGVVDVDVFTSIDDALSDSSMGNLASGGGESENVLSGVDLGSSTSSFGGVGQKLISTFIKAKNHRLLGGSGNGSSYSFAPTSAEKLFSYTHLVIRVKLRSNKVKLPNSLYQGNPIKVYPLLFTQGINEKQTLANNTGSSVTRLQDTINEKSFQALRAYCDRYCNYMASLPPTFMALRDHAPSRVEVTKILSKLEKLIASSRQTRKKRPEILQMSSDLCRRIAAGRVTVCKSAKDRTGMSVTLEQGRILVQNHHLLESKKAEIVSVMRSEGVRIENALKNTGRRVFAFNALQRSLLPEEYRCPPQTGGRNVS